MQTAEPRSKNTPLLRLSGDDNRCDYYTRAVALEEMVAHLSYCGVTWLVLESRCSQDNRDRTVIHRVLRHKGRPPFEYCYFEGVSEPLLWVSDAMAWAWDRGGRWRQVRDAGVMSRV